MSRRIGYYFYKTAACGGLSARAERGKEPLPMWNLLRKLKRLLRPDPVERFWRNREYIVRPAGWRKAFTPLYVHANQKILDRHNALIPCLEEISPFATPHGLAGIFISYGARVGQGCTVYHQVTIGSNTLPDSRGQGAPVIGDNVYIGAGAKIIGGVTAGGLKG